MTTLITLLTTALVAIGRTDLVWVLGTVGTDTLASLASALKSDTDNLAGGATAAAEWLAVGLTELMPAPLPPAPSPNRTFDYYMLHHSLDIIPGGRYKTEAEAMERVAQLTASHPDLTWVVTGYNRAGEHHSSFQVAHS